MARKVTYEDLEQLQEGQAALQEGQSALAAKVNELQGSLTKSETMLELGFCTLQSQQQVQVQELAAVTNQIQLGQSQQAKEMAEIKELFQQLTSYVEHKVDMVQTELDCTMETKLQDTSDSNLQK